ncbi:DUF2267 domain-containing protein [Desertibaculum subflavum]|uniref:DUF2267 domain-containing protein n=1 Tax=Desertibaculum subflavum TaxID=2268458 RepID=UPI000E6752B8
MTTTGLDTFDKTVQETNIWLKAVMEKLDTADRHRAYVTLRAVLHALRDRIGPENASHLGAQLPTLLRGVYYEGWHLAGTPTKERHKQQFLDHVRAEFPPSAVWDAEHATRAVFDVMWDKVDVGEVGKLIGALPKEIKDLWVGLGRNA